MSCLVVSGHKVFLQYISWLLPMVSILKCLWHQNLMLAASLQGVPFWQLENLLNIPVDLLGNSKLVLLIKRCDMVFQQLNVLSDI